MLLNQPRSPLRGGDSLHPEQRVSEFVQRFGVRQPNQVGNLVEDMHRILRPFADADFEQAVPAIIVVTRT